MHRPRVGTIVWISLGTLKLKKSMKKKLFNNKQMGEEISVGIRDHQGSVLSPFLFIIVLEALSREFRRSCLWELLYSDDLMIIA